MEDSLSSLPTLVYYYIAITVPVVMILVAWFIVSIIDYHDHRAEDGYVSKESLRRLRLR